jgi:phytoene dehydrogenase-like protein
MRPGSAYVLMHHWIGEVDGHAGAWGWVHGGMGAVSRCLAEAARAAGAEIRAGAPVARVGVRNGRAVGVEDKNCPGNLFSKSHRIKIRFWVESYVTIRLG